MNLSRLANKHVVITAAASGIGLCIAEAFLAHHAIVHIVDIDEESVLGLKTSHPDIDANLVDVSDLAATDAWFNNLLARVGAIDILVNNAGIAGPTAALEDIEPVDWERTLSVDLSSMFYCLRRVIPGMKQQRSGAIVNMSSTAGTMGFPRRTPYAAAKWGVIGLSKSLAMELGEFGINVNAVCPGSVEGERIDRVIAAEAKATASTEQAVRESYLRHVSMRTFVKAQDIADMVLYLCSDHGARISGQALTVDGHSETLSS